jgi:NTP pyrophosphatase (non-canonical NTP hydrolase)
MTTLSLQDYQQQALRTARSFDEKDELFDLVLGLVGESGEVAEKFKKLIRDHNSDLTKLDRDDMAKELGDVLWYIAVLAEYLGLSLDDIGKNNLAKLASRQKRGQLGGSGDDR